MVLESVEEITEDNQSQGYEIGDHELIFKNTYDSEEYGKEKKFTINARAPNAPSDFYYVHINVDLDQIRVVEDWAELESDASDSEVLNSAESDQTEISDDDDDDETTDTTDEEPEKKKRR